MEMYKLNQDVIHLKVGKGGKGGQASYISSRYSGGNGGDGMVIIEAIV